MRHITSQQKPVCAKNCPGHIFPLPLVLANHTQGRSPPGRKEEGEVRENKDLMSLCRGGGMGIGPNMFSFHHEGLRAKLRCSEIKESRLSHSSLLCSRHSILISLVQKFIATFILGMFGVSIGFAYTLACSLFFCMGPPHGCCQNQRGLSQQRLVSHWIDWFVCGKWKLTKDSFVKLFILGLLRKQNANIKFHSLSMGCLGGPQSV